MESSGGLDLTKGQSLEPSRPRRPQENANPGTRTRDEEIARLQAKVGVITMGAMLDFG